MRLLQRWKVQLKEVMMEYWVDLLPTVFFHQTQNEEHNTEAEEGRPTAVEMKEVSDASIQKNVMFLNT